LSWINRWLWKEKFKIKFCSICEYCRFILFVTVLYSCSSLEIKRISYKCILAICTVLPQRLSATYSIKLLRLEAYISVLGSSILWVQDFTTHLWTEPFMWVTSQIFYY
jgi:hypothetical protein